jgi:hypothetical protein
MLVEINHGDLLSGLILGKLLGLEIWLKAGFIDMLIMWILTAYPLGLC